MLKAFRSKASLGGRLSFVTLTWVPSYDSINASHALLSPVLMSLQLDENDSLEYQILALLPTVRHSQDAVLLCEDAAFLNCCHCSSLVCGFLRAGNRLGSAPSMWSLDD